MHVSGANYEKIRESDILRKLVKFEPHFVVFWIVGNEIGSRKSKEEIKRNMEDFYSVINDLMPYTCIIPTQAEFRINKKGNKWGAPIGMELKFKRNAINAYLNMKINKNALLVLSGKNNLDRKEMYGEDGVHFNSKGLEMFMQRVENCVEMLMEEAEQEEEENRAMEESTREILRALRKRKREE